ncbi:hypothetical protein TcBrA4_0085810 [Trypanosoma cruzi]|nr:hypothetical protein TcBrA4_0085810 [Trypanosoma cruzi]
MVGSQPKGLVGGRRLGKRHLNTRQATEFIFGMNLHGKRYAEEELENDKRKAEAKVHPDSREGFVTLFDGWCLSVLHVQLSVGTRK